MGELSGVRRTRFNTVQQPGNFTAVITCYRDAPHLPGNSYRSYREFVAMKCCYL